MLKKIDFQAVKITLVGIIVLIGFSWLLSWLGAKLLPQDEIRNFVEKMGIFGPLVIILLKSATLIFAPLGGNPVYIVTGFLYGFIPALVITLLGDLLGSTISFWVSRRFGKQIVVKLAGKKSISTIDAIYEEIGGWRGFLLASFFSLADYVNYAAGLTKIPYSKFLLVVFLFRIPANAAIISLAFFGDLAGFIKLGYLAVICVYLLALGIYWYKLSKTIKSNKALEDN
ncbi:hypothetical protein A2630_04660 [Candidatus Woesebacteria bacterium RIFCSPHIGHO2_01_FULL_44_10]|uniref:TVP38/TMEM64 family membrane protein n=1 Tax=Candidatus Woesebacteria bacterium RIFCSPLOWO2_01_FULL_44_14 TaxID=1802525 RepID=A0A1F8C4V6_9BACT|nr:MAG: hypothetical protein A2630_04660 [Candidatus Woesebacteria bacterium RIFCSPHIGHO2_01_FULL_44_10]OGM56045.1 MAG: hypothetical protein A3F62_03955 [Candidatus Woesebacteria bacterium RIFCSPHIGHO2_12_FULL_44_11]OGM70768.1 MAG: hypothetical protein A2975_02665 [Candidatus Woesebacteria bacterium RIFCSPLOWO2_01_FULL_44_14]